MSSKLDNQEKLKVVLCPPLCAVAHAHSYMNVYPHIYKHTENQKDYGFLWCNRQCHSLEKAFSKYLGDGYMMLLILLRL